jgi:hypothetical protein
MSESEAWSYLARMWARAVRGGTHEVRSQGRTLRGLCEGVSVLLWNGRITLKVSGAMHAAITKEPPQGGRNGFVWPRTVDGARQRAAFCRQMAQATVRRTTRAKTKA